MSEPKHNENIEQVTDNDHDLADQLPDTERQPDDANEHQVDEALEETFPASDPISP
ncbi:hypothetical protein [Pseudomonas matsuisoli]|uniref:Metallothionein n=1 Tax=Pseudomonas matsuisoli TaxID=1515666 RepID=A0A917PUD0_9PSED|nr:hypothetical protein [Pseudomonas matsuisoli]GGJ92060.1 hypothetical protein GCM10009304_17320 [Pseudomonas matsuisoli]